MTDDRAPWLTYCHEALLPIWERWTDGNPTLRRWLDCRSADPASHEERLRILIATTAALRTRGSGSTGVQAACKAASASVKAHLGVPEDEWQESVERALQADRDAGSASGSPPHRHVRTV